MDSRERTRGYILAVACAACAGTAVAVGKLGVHDAAPLTFSFWLSVFAVVFSGIWVRSRARGEDRRPDCVTWALAAGHAAISFAAVWMLWAGVQHLDAAVASFLGRVETLATVALAIVLLRERLVGIELVGAAVALAGVVVMKLPAGGLAGAGGTTGFWLALGAAVGFGSAEVLTKLAVRRCDPARFVFLRNVLVLLAFAVAGAVRGELAPAGPRFLGAAAGVALLAPTLARIFHATALRTLELTKTAVVNQAQPLFAAAAALILFRSSPTPVQWGGGALILAGCSLVILGAGGGGAPPAKWWRRGDSNP